MKAWYAFYTKPHCEFLADRALAARGLRTYLPILRPSDETQYELLFPRYLFVYCDLTAADNGDIRYFAGLGEVVAFDGQPAVVPGQTIGLIQEQLHQAALGGACPAKSRAPCGKPIEGPSGPQSTDDQDAAGPLAGLSADMEPSVPADVRGQALLSFLRQINRPDAPQEGAPGRKNIRRCSRGTRGHGRRIHYRTS